MSNAFNARPVLDRVTDGLTLLAMVGLTVVSAAAYAYSPAEETAEPQRLPLVVVTAKKVAEPVMLPQVVVTARRA